VRRAVLALALLVASAARADEPGPTFGSRFVLTEQGGSTIYHSVCAGCHMADGRGASGAGAYPSLANDERLAASNYPIERVLHGSKAMPPFGRMLTDEQVAAVVGFVRTNFGNDYTDVPTAAEVRAIR
jgi:mono/diheme cytochrome c family protein